MKNKFEGYYFKLQKGSRTLAVIPGCAKEGAFVQIVTNDRSYHIPYTHDEYFRDGFIVVGKNRFWKKGMILDIRHKDITLTGRIRFHNLTQLKKDIMGPFRHIPMECRHVVVSMRHDLEGTLELDGETIDFHGGIGYTEGDRGRSFPAGYTWAQCNVWDQEDDCAVMAAAANIPLAGRTFWGCIAAVCFEGREYRIATYKGAGVQCRTPEELVLSQGKMRLTVIAEENEGHMLYAPRQGSMSRMIHECAAAKARFIFEIDNRVIFDRCSSRASYEYCISGDLLVCPY